VFRPLLLLFFLLSTQSFSQRVNQKSATIRLEQLNNLKTDGLLTFEIEVRMADCFSYVELTDVKKLNKKKNIWDKIYDWWWFKVRKIYDFEISKTFTRELTEDNYSLKDTESIEEIIVMKCDLIQLKSVFPRKLLKRKLELNLYSKSGKKVYTKTFTLRKIKILEENEVRLGVKRFCRPPHNRSDNGPYFSISSIFPSLCSCRYSSKN
jgi:hypothetical protein